MWLVVGLGNPGSKYALTRHNIGFMAADRLLQIVGGSSAPRNEFKAEFYRFKWRDEDILVAKPQTYMNLSGESVQELVHFFRLPLDHLIVLHDEIEIPFGSIRIHKNRGHGGHNGVRDITSRLGSADYVRLRLGVGRPAEGPLSVADWVLQNFSDSESANLSEFLDRSARAVEAIIFSGLQKASTQFNA
ncbi:MAG: aminoacyl-tRNA hydrolase [Bdellovibrionaceae bacterium]|nr:aminoacyl-tRNA hydrolase [Pseudobdellovibrionaceae bacterium]